MKNKEIYSDKITKGTRTYFFDISESEKGDMYLKISESKKNENNFDHYRLMVFEEDVEDFANSFKKLLRKFYELRVTKLTDFNDSKAYSLDKIREVHSQAYKPWTKEDDKKLEILFCEGKNINELTEIFERNKGAINSRIKKLELKEKYGL